VKYFVWYESLTRWLKLKLIFYDKHTLNTVSELCAL